VRAALKRPHEPKADHGKHIAKVQRQVENLADAITAGQLRGSPARQTQPLTILVPDVEKRCLDMVGRLDDVLTADLEHGRQHCGMFSASASRCSRMALAASSGPRIRWGLHRSCRAQERVRI